MGLFDKLFGTYSDRELKRIKPIADKIEALADETAALSDEALKAKATFPCVIHWNFDHFVVLDGFSRGRAVINDPARGIVKVSMAEFDGAFTGIVITFAPSEGFTPSGKRKSTVDFARKRLRGAGVAAAFVALTTVISYLFEVINPAMSRVFFDRLLTGLSPGWLHPFIGLMALLCGVQLVVEWARTVYSLKINGKLAVVGSTSYMWKVLGLPMDFFSQRMAGDILQRQSTNASIAQTLVQTIAPLLLKKYTKPPIQRVSFESIQQGSGSK